MKYKFGKVLKDCTKLGKKIPVSQYLSNGKYPVIDQGKNKISGFRNEIDGVFDGVPAIIFGDHTRIVKYINKPFFIGADGVKILCVKDKNVNSKYLYYQLLNSNIPDTGYNRHFKWVKELEFKLPEQKEQKKVVECLDAVTNLIEKRKQQLTKFNLLVKSQFIEMFGNSDLSQINPEWIPISDIGTVVGGATPKTNVEAYWNGEYRWITPAELQSNSCYIYNSVRKLTKAGVDSCSLQEMPAGTVILSSRAPIGKVAIAGNTFYCNQGFKNIICSKRILPRYLYSLLLFNTKYLNSLGRGATFKEISKSIVENIRIPVPDMNLQQQFISFVEQVDKSKFTIEQSLKKLETLKRSLMNKYFG